MLVILLATIDSLMVRFIEHIFLGLEQKKIREKYMILHFFPRAILVQAIRSQFIRIKKKIYAI